MVNSKRVEYVCNLMQDKPEESSGNLSAWMFDAGFRSRNTAINAFKKIKGCTPSEYLKSCREEAGRRGQDTPQGFFKGR